MLIDSAFQHRFTEVNVIVSKALWHVHDELATMYQVVSDSGNNPWGCLWCMDSPGHKIEAEVRSEYRGSYRENKDMRLLEIRTTSRN